MKLDGAFRKVQFGSNLFIGKAPKNAVEDFLLAAGEFHIGFDALTGFQQFLCLIGKFKEAFSDCRDHNEVIAGRLATHHAMHSEQPSRVIYRKLPLRSCFNMEMSSSACLLVKQIDACSG